MEKNILIAINKSTNYVKAFNLMNIVYLIIITIVAFIVFYLLPLGILPHHILVSPM